MHCAPARSALQPAIDRREEELVEGDAVGPDQELPRRRISFAEAGKAGKAGTPRATLHFDGDQLPTASEDEVDFLAAVTPTEHFDSRARRTIDEMRADSGLHETTRAGLEADTLLLRFYLRARGACKSPDDSGACFLVMTDIQWVE